MEFSSNERVKAIRALTEALFKNVLYDEEPIFVSDQATMLDVSLTSPDELLKRCSVYYKTELSAEDLRRPLWQLLPELERRREAAD